MSKLKIAHFGNFAPNQCGMFHTTKDNVLAEREVGLISEFVDWGHARERGQQFSRVGLTYQGVTTVAPEWAIDEADILVLHSALPGFVKQCGKSIIVAIHGRPEYSFVLEKMGKGSCINIYHIHDKDSQVRGYYVFWQEHLDYWKMLLEKSVDYVPAMVDLNYYNPDGDKHSFSGHGPGPHIVIADIWREDVSPFNVLFAAAKFVEKNGGKIHVFGLSQPNKTTAMANILNPLKQRGLVGEVHGLIPFMDKVYRGADLLVTPHNIATRVVREALASGCPVVAGTGSKYTTYQADPHDIPAFTSEIEKCWKFDSNHRQQTVRKVAEEQFNLKQAGEACKKIYERVMKEPKPQLKIKTTIQKPNFKIHNFVVYCTPDEGKNIGKAYNKYMELIPDNDWACFLDHDAMFTTPNWYNQLYAVIQKNQDYNLFSVIANRIGNPDQRFAKIDQNNHDIRYHREIGGMAYDQHFTEIKDVTKGHRISGVVMLVSKKAWKKAGGFKEDGFLGIDNDFHSRVQKAGFKVGIMKGVYVYHWYRADGSTGLRPVER